MTKNKWIAGGVALIISAAEIVIIYELWLAGTWLLENAMYGPAISSAKTVSFILLFVGSLLAEMQELNRGTKWLLFGVVLLLGLYQTAINWTVNYYGANIPQRILDLFAPVWSTMWTEIAYAGMDAIVRSVVVVLMWLVAGQLWRGVALIISDDAKNIVAELRRQVAELQQRNDELSDTHKYGAMFAVMSDINQARLVDEMKKIANGQTPQLEAAAKAELKPYTRSRAKVKK